jgi:hypothetical protein
VEVKLNTTAAGRAGSAKSTAVAADDAAAYVESAALVAVTIQVPALVAFTEVPEITQPVAVPFVTAYVTAPVPEPPLVVKVNDVPKPAFVLVRLNVACVANVKVTVMANEFVEE